MSHTWEEDGAYEIKAESMDIWGDSYWSDKHIIFIGNQPPDPPTIDGPQCGDAGVEYEYTFKAYDFDGDDVICFKCVLIFKAYDIVSIKVICFKCVHI